MLLRRMEHFNEPRFLRSGVPVDGATSASYVHVNDVDVLASSDAKAYALVHPIKVERRERGLPATATDALDVRQLIGLRP